MIKRSLIQNNKTKLQLVYWLSVILWAYLIFYLSSLPIPVVSGVGWQEFVIKKSTHMFVYGVLAILLFRALGFNKIQKPGVLAVFLASLYGVTDEYHQSFTPGREPSIRDVAFDTIGAYLAVFVVWKYIEQKILKRLASWAKSLLNRLLEGKAKTRLL